MVATRGGVLRSASGRVRLGWRLGLFLVVAFVVLSVVILMLPEGLFGAGLSMLAAALVAGALVIRMDGRGAGALGFHLARSVPREALLGVALGLGLAVAVVGLMAAGGALRWSGEAGTPVAWLGSAVAAAGILALPAAAEEALFRGYPFQALAEAWSPAWALAVSAALFGAAHLANPGSTALGAANTAAAGVFLGVVYLRTGSLWWASGAHLGWNWGLGFLADLPVSGLELIDAPMIAASVQGPTWLSGGAFGPEGSLVATLGFLGAAAAGWWGPWLRPEPAALARKSLVFASDADPAGTGPAPA